MSNLKPHKFPQPEEDIVNKKKHVDNNNNSISRDIIEETANEKRANTFLSTVTEFVKRKMDDRKYTYEDKNVVVEITQYLRNYAEKFEMKLLFIDGSHFFNMGLSKLSMSFDMNTLAGLAKICKNKLNDVVFFSSCPGEGTPSSDTARPSMKMEIFISFSNNLGVYFQPLSLENAKGFDIIDMSQYLLTFDRFKTSEDFKLVNSICFTVSNIDIFVPIITPVFVQRELENSAGKFVLSIDFPGLKKITFSFIEKLYKLIEKRVHEISIIPTLEKDLTLRIVLTEIGYNSNVLPVKLVRRSEDFVTKKRKFNGDESSPLSDSELTSTTSLTPNKKNKI